MKIIVSWIIAFFVFIPFVASISVIVPQNLAILSFFFSAIYWIIIGPAIVRFFRRRFEARIDEINKLKQDGWACSKLGPYNVLEKLKQEICIKPDQIELHIALGDAYRALGRYDEAVETFKQATRIKPDYADAHYFLGLAYLLLKDSGSALEEYKILKTLDKDKADQLFISIYYKERPE